MSSRRFETRVVLSLTTGFLLCDFGAMQDCAEWVAGHPLWTHEFAERATWERLKQRVFAQHPKISKVRDFGLYRRDHNIQGDISKAEVEAYVRAQNEAFGDWIDLEGGTDQRTETPIESWDRISGGKPAMVLVVDDKGKKPC